MACPPFAIARVNGRKVTPEAEITGTPSGKLNSGGGDGIPHSREYPPHGSLSAAGPRRALQSKFANMMSCEIPNVNPPIVMSKLIGDRKSTRLNSSHEWISYAVFCLKKKIK